MKGSEKSWTTGFTNEVIAPKMAPTITSVTIWSLRSAPVTVIPSNSRAAAPRARTLTTIQTTKRMASA